MGKYEEITLFRLNETEEEVVLGADRNSTHRKIIILAIKSS